MLHLFPERGLDQSILVAVLIGIYVLLFFTEVFGWVWAGLVVPGYLASVFAIQPAAGVAVSFEAVLTFVLARGLSDVMARLGGWSPFFGRERFFLIVLISVIARQVCEVWLIDDLLGLFDAAAGTHHAAIHDFASIGLVLVPLLANMFWKLTLPRGLLQTGVTVFITWAALVLVLLPYTNLSYSSLVLTYEDVALDFLGSPKAYVILLTTAFLAAHGNLAYGWDYNGILVPSLLALTWFRPWSTVATIVEAILLLWMSRAALALPVLRRRNLEGPRKVTVVFTVGFLLKFAIGWAIGDRWPALNVTDLYGFGYVLTSLIAVKMLTVKKIGRVVLPSLAVSVAGFVLGSGLGFALEQVAPRRDRELTAIAQTGATSGRLLSSPLGAMAAATVRARPELPHRLSGGRPAAELADYGRLWRDLDAWLAGERPGPGELTARAAGLGLVLAPLADGSGWVLAEREEQLGDQVGWDVAVLYPGAAGPVLEVPRPRREAPAAEAATVLCARLACRAILASGSDGLDDDTAADPDRHGRATFQVAHRALRRQAVIQLRADDGVAPGRPVLHIRHALPDRVRLPALWPSEVELSWTAPPRGDLAWQGGGQLTVLRVHPDDLWGLLSAAAPPPATTAGVSVATWLAGWLDRPRAGPDPSPTELRVLEELVVTRLAGRRTAQVAWTAQVARALDHDVGWLADGAGPGRGAWVLAGRDDAGWLAVAVAAAADLPLVLEVPRPRLETGSGRIAAAAFLASGASALLVDAERAVDPTVAGNVATPFQAAHQALCRTTTGDDAAVIQLRGFAAHRAIDAELVTSLGPPLLDARQAPAAIAALIAPNGALGRLASSRRWVDGSAELGELTGSGSPQLLFARALGGPPFALVWLAESVRARTMPVRGKDDLAAIATALDVRFAEASLVDALVGGLTAGASAPALATRLDPTLGPARDWAATGDVAALALLIDQAARRPAVGLRLGWSSDLLVDYVLVEARGGGAVIRTAVLGRPGTACAPIDAGPDAAAAVWRDVAAGCAQLSVRGAEATP